MSSQSRYRVALACSEFNAAVQASELHVHDGLVETDLEFVLRAFDSALPYLASIGSEGQWGTTPFSQRPIYIQTFRQYIEESSRIHQNAVTSANGQSEAVDGWKQMVLFETRTDDTMEWRRVAAMGISVEVPDYVGTDLLTQDIRQEAKYVYLNYLIADRRAGVLARNTAQLLVQNQAMTQARLIGKKVIFVDCWRGNQGGLVNYYRKIGFATVCPFSVPGKHDPKLPWDGCLLKMELD